jgi:hypothetical protein
MTGYGFARALQMFVGLALFICVGLTACIWCICSEYSTENEFRRRYGAEWRTQYENIHGSLAEARAKSAVSGVGLIAIASVTAWLWRILRRSRNCERKDHREHGHRRSRHSSLERIIIYRRNALLGIYFGLPGMLLGALLVIFRWGFFRDHSNEVVLGMFVFLAGYAGIITGCGYWLKAKQWNEAIVLIGLIPLVIPAVTLFIPFVRLILIAELALLPIGLFMMSLILIVVVFALPDKSRIGRHQEHRRRAFRSRRSDRFPARENVKPEQP